MLRIPELSMVLDQVARRLPPLSRFVAALERRS
jgi:hypothetical protein